MPFHDGGRPHDLSQVFSLVEKLGQDDPEDAEGVVEAWCGSLPGLDAVLADGQLALQREDPGGKHGFGLKHRPAEADEIPETAADRMHGSAHRASNVRSS